MRIPTLPTSFSFAIPQRQPSARLVRTSCPFHSCSSDTGSTAWAATYPTSKPDPSKVPAAWTASLNAAVAAGKIPSIPPSTVNAAGVPVYAGGLDPNGKQVCSATYKCRIPGDVWDAPDGVYALGFDDGPLPVSCLRVPSKLALTRLQGSSDTLYEFLHNNSQHATHFMIGVNILANQAQFNYAFATLQDDIAVHTYTHPMMTTLSNEQVIAELGYTVQLIRDLTGGRLPRFWRPPFGDSDTRVRAIALEVFGLVTIIWNQE
jgi:chitin deacetylase